MSGKIYLLLFVMIVGCAPVSEPTPEPLIFEIETSCISTACLHPTYPNNRGLWYPPPIWRRMMRGGKL